MAAETEAERRAREEEEANTATATTITDASFSSTDDADDSGSSSSSQATDSEAYDDYESQYGDGDDYVPFTEIADIAQDYQNQSKYDKAQANADAAAAIANMGVEWIAGGKLEEHLLGGFDLEYDDLDIQNYEGEQYNVDPETGEFTGETVYGEQDELGAAIQAGLAAGGDREAPQMEGATIDTQQQGQARDQLGLLGGELWDRQQGKTPSIAEMQLQQSRDANIAQAMSLAASQSGISPALALKMAQEQGGSANIAASQQGAILRAQEQQQAEGALAGLYGDMRQDDLGLATGQAGLDQSTAEANLGAQLDTQAQIDQAAQGYLEAGLSREEAQAQAELDVAALEAEQQQHQNELQAEMQMQQNDMQMKMAMERAKLQAKSKGGLFGAVGSIVGAAVSDERLKENVESGGKDLDEFMNALGAHVYDYKNKEHGEGKHYGVMAQELEKSPVGDQFVIDTPEGKIVDYGQGLGAMMASIARLNEKINKLERKKKGDK